MRTTAAVIAVCSSLSFLSGCATAPAPSTATPNATPVKPAPAGSAAKAAAPASTPSVAAPTVAAPQIVLPQLNTPLEAPKLSPETQALVERLTSDSSSGALPHEVTTVTGFPSALESLEAGALAPSTERVDMTGQPPARGLTADGNTTALVEKDWTGLVLVPVATSLSKAYTSDVRLVKVEAHPLNDGRVRIWTRVHNIGTTPLPAEIACEFRMDGAHANSPYFYQLDVPGRGYRDVFFISPDGSLNAYTVLVRSIDALRR